MKSYKTKIRLSVILLASMSAVSCNQSTETQSNLGEADPVATLSKPTVALTTEQVNAVVGEVFTVDISTRDFPVSEGGGLSVQFDASLLNATDVTINTSHWDFVNKVGNIDNNTGLISDILFSSYNGVSGDSPIATITFNAIASGSSQIVLENSSINPFSSNGNVIVTNFSHSNVQIAAAQ